MSMAKEITKQLAEESKQAAKGCDWDVYQKECDRNEGLEYEIEQLKARVAELESELKNYQFTDECDSTDLEDLQDELPKIMADAIREATPPIRTGIMAMRSRTIRGFNECCRVMLKKADKLERGE